MLLLVRLAMVGDDPRGRWTEAFAILRPLKSKLVPVQQGWIPDIEGGACQAHARERAVGPPQ